MCVLRAKYFETFCSHVFQLTTIRFVPIFFFIILCYLLLLLFLLKNIRTGNIATYFVSSMTYIQNKLLLWRYYLLIIFRTFFFNQNHFQPSSFIFLQVLFIDKHQIHILCDKKNKSKLFGNIATYFVSPMTYNQNKPVLRHLYLLTIFRTFLFNQNHFEPSFFVAPT